MADILDLLKNKSKYPMQGKYWRDLPNNDLNSPSGMHFNYNYTEINSYTWTMLFGNIQGSQVQVGIRTNDTLPLIQANDNGSYGYVLLQDGTLYEIIQVEKNYSGVPQQVLRLFPEPPMVEKYLALSRRRNEWGLK